MRRSPMSMTHGSGWRRPCARIWKCCSTTPAFARVIVRVMPADVPEAARDLRRLRDGYEARFRAADRCARRLRPASTARCCA